MSNNIYPSHFKAQSEIASEWDAVSEKRNEEITSGKDISYHHVLMPTIISQISNWAGKRVLDIGCGSGHLSHLLASKQAEVTGIDISANAIGLAKSTVANTRPHFKHTSIEDYAESHLDVKFDVVIANMVLQSVPNLRPFLASAHAVTREDLLVTLPHPCFWPKYWGFEAADWYEYTKEIPIEAPFRTTHNPTGAGCITYIHRPLSRYFSSLRENGFQIVEFRELIPTPDAMRLYPIKWAYPRFIFLMIKALNE